ncbi:hypothetical protein FKM82_019387 [Ascaphus truei]
MYRRKHPQGTKSIKCLSDDAVDSKHSLYYLGMTNKRLPQSTKHHTLVLLQISDSVLACKCVTFASLFYFLRILSKVIASCIAQHCKYGYAVSTTWGTENLWPSRPNSVVGLKGGVICMLKTLTNA